MVGGWKGFLTYAPTVVVLYLVSLNYLKIRYLEIRYQACQVALT